MLESLQYFSDEEEDVVVKVKTPVTPVHKGKGASRDNPLDSFFPFDPYLLRRSSRFINNIYVRWTLKGVQSSEVDEEEWSEEGRRMSSESPGVASLVGSLTAMSLTPLSLSLDDFHQSVAVIGSVESMQVIILLHKIHVNATIYSYKIFHSLWKRRICRNFRLSGIMRVVGRKAIARNICI